MVLSACSSYFENLFTTFSERNQIVILKDTSYDDAVALVEFMYRGEINVPQEQLASLLKTAENLRIKGLAEVSSAAAAAEPDLTIRQQQPKIKHRPQHQQHHHFEPKPSVAAPNGGDVVKRKRGRPRILDSPGELPDPCFSSARISSGDPVAAAPTKSNNNNRVHAIDLPPPQSMMTEEDFGDQMLPTPGGPLTPDRVASLGIVKMNDYLVSGTRQQFWEEYYVKVIMQVSRRS